MAANTMSEKIEQIEAELVRLGWACTDDQPTQFVATEDGANPGLVRLTDDYSELVGDADQVLAALRALDADAEYGQFFL